MRAGATVSGVLHAAAIGLAVFGALLFPGARAFNVEVSQVALISAADFDAAISNAPTTPERGFAPPPAPQTPTAPDAPARAPTAQAAQTPVSAPAARPDPAPDAAPAAATAPDAPAQLARPATPPAATAPAAPTPPRQAQPAAAPPRATPPVEQAAPPASPSLRVAAVDSAPPARAPSATFAPPTPAAPQEAPPAPVAEDGDLPPALSALSPDPAPSAASGPVVESAAPVRSAPPSRRPDRPTPPVAAAAPNAPTPPAAQQRPTQPAGPTEAQRRAAERAAVEAALAAANTPPAPAAVSQGGAERAARPVPGAVIRGLESGVQRYFNPLRDQLNAPGLKVTFSVKIGPDGQIIGRPEVIAPPAPLDRSHRSLMLFGNRALIDAAANGVFRQMPAEHLGAGRDFVVNFTPEGAVLQ